MQTGKPSKPVISEKNILGSTASERQQNKKWLHRTTYIGDELTIPKFKDKLQR